MNKTLERIEELRNRHKYSVNQMCKDIGIPQSTYATWLKDDREPKPKYVRSVAEYFNKPISYFYDDQKKETPTVNSERERKLMKATELLERYSEEDLAWVLQMLERMPPSEK